MTEARATFRRAEDAFKKAAAAFEAKDLDGCDEILRAEFFPLVPFLDDLQRRRFIVRSRECGQDQATFRRMAERAVRYSADQGGRPGTPEGPRTMNQVEDPARRERAEEIASDSGLLERFARDVAAIGVVGIERQTKLTLLVAASGILLPRPLSLILKGETSEGKSFPSKRVLEFLPPEVVLIRSQLSAKALFYSNESLENAVLLLEEYAGGEQADYPIRLAQSEGLLVAETTVKDADGGGFRTERYEKRARLAIMLTTNRVQLDAQNESRALAIYADGTPEQTRRILITEGRRVGSAAELLRDQSEIVEPWRDYFRMLRTFRVVVPFGESLAASFPADRPRARRDFTGLLGAIQVCALLHQKQRESVREVRGGEEIELLVAEWRDYELVRPLVEWSLGSATGGLSERGKLVVECVERLVAGRDGTAVVKTGEIVVELREHGMARRTLSQHLSEAVEKGFLERAKGGRGVEGEYRLLRRAESFGEGEPPENGGETEEWQELADDPGQEGSHEHASA